MVELLTLARREAQRRGGAPSLDAVRGRRDFAWYLWRRNRLFVAREAGTWLLNGAEAALAWWLLGGMTARGVALGATYVALAASAWNGASIAARVLTARYEHARAPHRIARVAATFTQLGALGGLVCALVCAAAAALLIPGSDPDARWARLLLGSRAALLVPELASAGLFACAYTLRRTYWPLWVSFIIKAALVASNIVLVPQFGPVILLALQALRVLAGSGAMFWSARRALAQCAVGPLPFLVPPQWDGAVVREMMPLAGARCLGALMAGAYNVIVMTIVAIALPRQTMLYHLFYQVLGIMFIVPRRLSRSVFFDVTRLVSMSREAMVKRLVTWLDSWAIASGGVLALICGCAALACGSVLPPFLHVHPAEVRGLLAAAALFFLVHPSNAVWQSVREAAGETRFTNRLLFVTHYLLALPVATVLLLCLRGTLREQEAAGLDFVVVSHGCTFAWVLVADSVAEAVRAIASRIHILRFAWLRESPLARAARILECDDAWKTLTATLSPDLACLWHERFARGPEPGLLSFPFWACAAARALRECRTARQDIGFLRLTFVRRRRAGNRRQRNRGSAFHRHIPEDCTCACLLTGDTVLALYSMKPLDDFHAAIARIHEHAGFILGACSFVHASTDEAVRTGSLADCIAALFGVTGRNGEALLAAAPRIYRLESASHPALVRAFSASGTTACGDHDGLRALLSTALGRPVTWVPTVNVATGTGDDAAQIAAEGAHAIARSRVPSFALFLRGRARGVLPWYEGTALRGVFQYAPLDTATQRQALAWSAAAYVRDTAAKAETGDWLAIPTAGQVWH